MCFLNAFCWVEIWHLDCYLSRYLFEHIKNCFVSFFEPFPKNLLISPVWQKLEEENQEFFRAYHLRLIVKDQIQRFNKLLERHVELIRQICPTGVSSITLHNGSEMRPCKKLLSKFDVSS